MQKSFEIKNHLHKYAENNKNLHTLKETIRKSNEFKAKILNCINFTKTIRNQQNSADIN